MARELDGQVALITGAASGIGRATAVRLASAGATVVAGDVDGAGLAGLASELGAACLTQHCDVTVESDVEALVALALAQVGRLDIAVANAGAGTAGLLVELPLDEWRRIVDLCLTGVFLTVKHAGKAMVGAGRGSIVTVASLNAVQPGRGMGAYCSAKAGVAMLTEVAALEMGPAGVRCNAVAPGLVRTGATEPLWSLPGIVEEYVENTPLGRYASAAEVAEVIAFLAGDDASFMSGALVSVDGGARTRRYPDIIAGVERALGGS